MPISDVPHAIPTEYNGHQFRSRLEATVAWLLDAMAVRWEYEPQSFLLPNGVQYIPDFYCRDLELWVEVRGYDTPRGRQQILGFCEHLFPDILWADHALDEGIPKSQFLVIGPRSFGWIGGEIRGYLQWYAWLLVARCPDAGLYFTPLVRQPYCPYCRCLMGGEHSIQGCLHLAGGKILTHSPLDRDATYCLPDQGWKEQLGGVA